MLKILTSQHVKELDAYTIRQEPIASIDLMERACHAFVSWFVEKFSLHKKVAVVCGTGNNGGDGLGIARLLISLGYTVTVYCVKGSTSGSEDFQVNLKRLTGKTNVSELVPGFDKTIFSNSDVLIDAIFGSGLSRPVEGIYADVIACMNTSDATRVAVDIPSGLMADRHSTGTIVHAHDTVTFQLPKLAFLLPENFPYVGRWHVVDIKLDETFIKKAESKNYVLTKEDISKILKPRSTFDHKGVFGHALIIAGSHGKMGAAVLAGRAAMRSGAGLLTIHAPSVGYEILQSTLPEAMVSVDAGSDFFTTLPEIEKYNAIGIGPGIGKEKESVKAITSLLKKNNAPMVIDADGLNILAENRELFSLITEGSILTPHPKEFERLVGKWTDDIDRLQKQRDLALQIKSVVIVKGANTSIAAPDGTVYFNSTGNPGMATGGSGDVLTGMLTAFLAQSYTPVEAAQLGVYLHGLAGDLAAREKGMPSLIASDIVEFIPEAFKTI